MQYGQPESPGAHSESSAAGESRSAQALVVELVGERKRVLDLGCGKGELAALLSRRECDIFGIDSNPAAVEEARAYCVHAVLGDIDGTPLVDLVGERRYDVVLLSDVLRYLRQPTRVLDGARDMLLDGGFLVAVVSNVAHGAIRLSLIGGQFDRRADETADETALRQFTAKTIDELFLSAGYRIDALQRVKHALFEPSDLLPAVDRNDYDPAIVARIESDPESETLQFVVRASPLSNDAKTRAIAKRFLIANTELAAQTARLEQRERDIERLNALVAAAQAELAETRLRLTTSTDQIEHRALEHARREAQSQSAALLERAHSAELEIARLTERLSAQHEASTDATARIVVDESELIEERQRAADELSSTVAFIRHEIAETEQSYSSRVADLEAQLQILDAERDTLALRTTELEDILRIADAEIAKLSEEAHNYAGLLTIADDETRALRDRVIALEREVVADAETLAKRVQAFDSATMEFEATIGRQTHRLEQLENVLAETRQNAEQQVADIRTWAQQQAGLARHETEQKIAAAREAVDEQLANANDTFKAERLKFDEALSEARREVSTLQLKLADENKRYQHLERTFADQTQALLDQTRAEAERVALLIDAVQSSFFWRVKRAIGRLRGHAAK